jgi:small conductance mechanosensitive channel
LTALRLVVNAGRYALVISAILMTLRTLHVPLDSLLLPAGFLGAALGLGAQNLVRDVVAGLFIVFEGTSP